MIKKSKIGVHLVGVTVQAPPPIASVEIRFEQGLDVLYGRNGAGKSRVLAGLAGACGRQQPTEPGGLDSCLVHLAMGPGGDTGLARELLSAFDTTRRYGGAPAPVVPDASWEQTDDELRTRIGRVLYGQALWSFEQDSIEDDRWLRQFVGEALAPDLQIVLATADGHTWLLWLGVLVHEAQPLVRTWIRELHADHVAKGKYQWSDSRLESVAGNFLDSGFAIDPSSLFDHPWAALPTFNLGASVGMNFMTSVPVIREGADKGNVNQVTAQWLRAGHEQAAVPGQRAQRSLVKSLTGEGLMRFVHPAQTRLSRIAARANGLYSNLLVDAPILTCQSSEIIDWWENEPPLRWRAKDPSGALVEVSQLSSAQARWARTCIDLALTLDENKGEEDDEEDDDDGPSGAASGLRAIIILDEPELGLHATAQRFLAEGLRHLTATENIQMVISTHSPALLTPTKARLLHVRRNEEGLTIAVRLPSLLEADTAELGVNAADLIQLTRTFVLVEGRHDELIFSTVLGDDLRDRSAHILALRGAKRLQSVLDARFLFEYTDARVLVVLDNLSEHVEACWREARRRAERNDPSGAVDTLLNGLDRKVDEQQFLQEFGIRAVEERQIGRLAVAGLRVPDVVDLLPVAAIAPGFAGRTWGELRSDPRAPAKSGTFKTWATAHLSARFDDETIIAAAKSLDRVPDDLRRVLDALDVLER